MEKEQDVYAVTVVVNGVDFGSVIWNQFTENFPQSGDEEESCIYIMNNSLSMAEVLYDFDIEDYTYNISAEFLVIRHWQQGMLCQAMCLIR